MTEARDRTHVVRDEDDRAPFVAHPVEDVEALLLEGGVAHGQHLVDQQYVGIDLDRNRKGQAHVHPRGVVLELEVLKLFELGELDHPLVASASLPRREPEHDAVERHVVVGGQVGIEADAQLYERGHPTVAPDLPLVGTVDAGQALQERALATAVAPDYAEELPRLDREGDVLQRVQLLVTRAAQRVKRPLLERMAAFLRDLEALVNSLGGERRASLEGCLLSGHGNWRV